ncbi:P-II family nitrogen regulator [Clostridium chromiireducens]|uniref:P-II family nitrogen regulator n=1 Tax=Clostridium chromiireducens TaxID=225345 RepID=UPI003AF5E8FC
MLMVRAIIRIEKVEDVLKELSIAGFPSVSKMDVVGRGKQKGFKYGDVLYDEIPKEMLLFIINDEDKDKVIDIIMRIAKTGENGAFGDGKIFVSPVYEAYTVSTNSKGL